MLDIPKVKLGNSGVEVTRIISGGNPLCANSHFSPDMSKEMGRYYTPEGVVAYLHELEKSGINTLQARGDFHRILYWVELFKRQGGQLHFIAQTASEMHDVFSNIRVIAATGAVGIYHHGSRTDNLWLDGRIDEVEDYLKCMRDCGVQVGLGSHIPEVIEYAEEKGWDVDFYMTCLYNLNREKRESALVVNPAFNEGSSEIFDPGDPPRMYRVIRQTHRMCLVFKVLAAGRRCRSQDGVRDAFDFAFANIKPKDAVVVGMFPKHEDQINLNVEYTLNAIEACESTVPAE